MVATHLAAAQSDETARCPISLINLGEVFYRLHRLQGTETAEAFWGDALAGTLPLQPVEPTRRRVREASALKARYPIAFADAFAVQLAIERGMPLLTGDPEIQAVEGREPIEVLWLPRKR